MIKFEILHRFDGSVLFAHESEGNSLKITLLEAIKAQADLHGADLHGADLYGADLHGANLYGADLHGADLHGADLHGADLHGADLRGADLYGANLYGANLRGADLHGADLHGANLYGADLRGAKVNENELVGKRPFMSVSNVGSRNDTIMCFLTDKGAILKTGCFFGTIEEFEVKLIEEHGTNVHAQEYGAVLELFKTHAKLWSAEND